MKSMTGFGRSSSQSSGAPAVSESTPEIDLSIRAVNGRFLEIRFHLPREYAGLESDFKAILQKTFSRGTLDIFVNRARKSQKAEVAANSQLASQFMSAYRQLGDDLKLAGEPSLDWLVRIPDVLAVREHSEITPEEATLAKTLLEDAAKKCDAERIREGAALKSELERHLSALETLSQSFETLKTEANSELEKRYRERLQTAIQKFGPGGQLDEQRMAQEVVMQLDRADISEELQRLREHVKAYRDLLAKKEPQGKKLDFYAQELLREVNTIGSKSHIAKLTSLVVEAKTLVERIREQVQNAE